MRNAFASEITELAKRDERIVLLSGDIGNRLFDVFKKECPGRFFNCGVAEANMIGMAAGMALSGLRPVAYTITPFITARCLDQIRIDVCYQQTKVVIVGTGSGLCYASLNVTHQSCEDLATLRVLPGLTLLCPGDPVETRLSLKAAMDNDGPVYLRLGKKGEPTVHKANPDFSIGKWIELVNGSDVYLLSTGNMLSVAMQVSDNLAKEDVSCGVMSCHTVKPLDADSLARVFGLVKLVVVVEEHSVLGGFGSSLAEWVSETRVIARLLRIGIADSCLYKSYNQSEAREAYGLTAEGMTQKILWHLQQL